MSMADSLQRLFKRESQQLVYAEIDSNHVEGGIEPTALSAEQHYFRVWLSEAFLADDRRLFRTFVPVVHSNVRLVFGSNATQELPYVAGPQNVGIGTTLGKGVQLNHPLTNLLPFRGGAVSIAAALLAYKEKDFFSGFLSVLNQVSGLLNVGQLSTTLKVVEGTVDGIQSLLAAGDKDVHLVYFQGFAGTGPGGGSPIKAGYTAIVRAPTQKLDSKALFVKAGRLHKGSSLENCQPLDGYDYMLLRTEVATTRDDYLAFDEFKKLLFDAVKTGSQDPDAGREIIRTAQVVAWASPDLTNADRVRIAKAISIEYEKAIGASSTEKNVRSFAGGAKSITDASLDWQPDDKFIERFSKQEAVRLSERWQGRPEYEDFIEAVR